MLVLLTGINYVAVRFSNLGLPPFLGAGLRFGAASLIFLPYVVMRGFPLPRGRALAGAVLYGFLQFGVSYALTYHAMLQVPAGLQSVIIASSPVFTLLFASAARIELLTRRGVLGALVAFAGIALLFGERAGKDIPVTYLLSAFGTVIVISLTAVIFKLIPPVHPHSMNGVGMLSGALFLFGLSFASGEEIALPVQFSTWVVLLYLVLFGSVFMYTVLLYVLKRWTASGVSYQTVLSPIVATLLSAWLLAEPVTGRFMLGSALVLSGVYLGSLADAVKTSLGPRAKIKPGSRES